METFVKVAIVGGGLSGLMAAQTLKKYGIEDLLVIDKSRSVGGRLATRRIEDGRVDHGAQFFTVRTAEFQTIVDSWLAKGWIRHWFGDQHPRYLSEGGMNSLAKRLAENIPTLLNTRVLTIQKEDQYILVTEEGQKIYAEAVIITAPTPQAIPLVKPFANAEQLEKLESVQFSPCLVGIFELATESQFNASGHQDRQLPDGMLRIVDHKKKGISANPIISVYMQGNWSKFNFERQDAEVLESIKNIVSELLPLGNLKSEQLKRWRYAQAKTFVQEPFLQIAQRFFVAGDSFLSENDSVHKVRFESAVLSGIAVGEKVSQQL